MLSVEARSRLTIVLVGARNPQNIGAAARAMQDFGFSDLRVVNSFAPPFEAAQLEAKSAVRAEEVMRSARLFTSLPEAVHDCMVLVGTTAIGGRGLTQPVLPLQEAAVLVQSALCGTEGEAAIQLPESRPDGTRKRVALLFGSEKTGLTKEQLSFCSLLVTIPMYAPEGRHLSMNLGQAVAVCLYELSRAGFEGSRALPVSTQSPGTLEDAERLLALTLEVMEKSGYTRRFPANARPSIVRRLILSLASEQKEAATWMGFFRQLLRTLPSVNE